VSAERATADESGVASFFHHEKRGADWQPASAVIAAMVNEVRMSVDAMSAEPGPNRTDLQIRS
jgi:hypothetical protein